MAFLGKISAVVTANTTDFTKKIEGTSKQILDLKRKVGGFQLNLNTKSLDGTLTQLQRFNRTLQEAAKLSASVRLANGFPDLGKLAAQFKAFEDVGKPLTKVKSEIEGLANSVQSRLYPELEKVQKGFQDLYRELGDGRVTEAGKVITTTFEQAASRVDGLTAALTRLSRVSAAAKDIGGLVANLNANNTGASFFQPATQSELQRSLTLRGKAEKLPARLRTGIFADLSVEAEANAQKIEEQVARVGAAVLKAQRNSRFSRTPAGRETLAREQGELDRLTRQQEIINNQLAREIRSAEIKQIISPEADSAVDRLKTKFERLAGELRAINGARFDGVIGSVGTLVDQLNRGEVSARKVSAALDGLSKVRAASEIGASYEDAAERALRSQQERDRSTVQEAAAFQRQQIRQVSAGRFRRLNESVIRSDERISGLEGQRQELVALRDSGRLGDDSAIAQVESQIAAERARRARAAALAARVGSARVRSLSAVDVNEQIGIERIGFSDVVARQRDLQQRAESLGIAPLIKEANQLNKTAIDLKRSLSAAFQAAKDDPEAGVASLEKFRAKLYGQIAAYDSLDKKIRTASDAQRQFNLFLAASGGLSDKLDPTLEGVASDIATTKQFRGQYGRDNDLGRVATAERVALAERRVNSLILQRQKIEEAKGLSDEKRAKAFAKNRRLIEAEGQAALDAAADNSGGIFPRSQVNAAAARRRKSTGSFGISGTATAQLAVQQGLFAIDDLISSTGGLEYKLRAVGNNITQLGLLLGQSGVIPGLSATAGLAAGLAVVLGGQLVSAFLRWATGAKKAEEAAQALNKSLSLQKTLFAQISDGVQSVGGDVAAKGFSDATAAANQFAKALEGIAKQQSKLNAERLLVAGSNLPSGGVPPDVSSFDGVLWRPTRSTILAGRAELERIDERSRAADRPGEIIALQRQRNEIARNEFRAAGRVASERSPAGAAVRNAIEEASRRLRAASNPMGVEGTADALASGDTRLGPLLGFGGSAGGLVLRAASAQAQRIAESLPVGQSMEDRLAQISALDDVIERLKPVATQEAIGFQTTASNAAERTIAELEGLQIRLRQEVGLLDFLREASKASRDLASAQKIASSALEDSVPGALGLRERLDSYAKEIDDANTAINDANAFLRDGSISQEERNAIVERQRGVIRSSAAGRRRAIEEADPFAFASIVTPGRLLRNRISDASSRLSAVGFGEGEIARQLRVIEAERQRATRFLESRRGEDGTIDAASQQAFENWNAELNRQAAELQVATRYVEAFADVIGRAQRETDSNLQAAISRTEETRRDQFAFDSPRTLAERDIAAADEQRSRLLRNQAQDAIDSERARLEQQALGGDGPLVETFRRLEEINQRLNDGGVPVAERQALIRERRALQDSVDSTVGSSDEVRRRIDASTAEDERQLSARRGRQLFQTDAEKLAEQVARGVTDIGQEIERRRSQAEIGFEAGGRRDQAGFQKEIETIQKKGAEALSRFVGEQSRQAAPAIFSLADSVQNAILQGPSRAALNAADVTTTEGARELNRLLRGDDPAKDVNIVELQKQSELLAQISKAAQETAAKMGIVLDFK